MLFKCSQVQLAVGVNNISHISRFRSTRMQCRLLSLAHVHMQLIMYQTVSFKILVSCTQVFKAVFSISLVQTHERYLRVK